MPDAITFLGTSDGLPSPDRYHASLLVRLAGRTLLLDAGEPCSHALKRLGVDFNSIDAVLISHTHSDHVGGLPMLIQSMWLENRRRALPVYLPGHARRPLRAWLSACYLDESRFKYRIRWRALAAANIGGVRLRCFCTTHEHDAFCLLLEAGHRRIGYSGDIGHPRDLTPLLRKPLDLLVVELAHFHPDALAEFLRDKAVRHVAVTHMGRPMRARLAEVGRRLRRALRPRRVTFVADGDVIKL